MKTLRDILKDEYRDEAKKIGSWNKYLLNKIEQLADKPLDSKDYALNVKYFIKALDKVEKKYLVYRLTSAYYFVTDQLINNKADRYIKEYEHTHPLR